MAERVASGLGLLARSLVSRGHMRVHRTELCAANSSGPTLIEKGLSSVDETLVESEVPPSTCEYW